MNRLLLSTAATALLVSSVVADTPPGIPADQISYALLWQKEMGYSYDLSVMGFDVSSMIVKDSANFYSLDAFNGNEHWSLYAQSTWGIDLSPVNTLTVHTSTSYSNDGSSSVVWSIYDTSGQLRFEIPGQKNMWTPPLSDNNGIHYVWSNTENYDWTNNTADFSTTISGYTTDGNPVVSIEDEDSAISSYPTPVVTDDGKRFVSALRTPTQNEYGYLEDSTTIGIFDVENGTQIIEYPLSDGAAYINQMYLSPDQSTVYVYFNDYSNNAYQNKLMAIDINLGAHKWLKALSGYPQMLNATKDGSAVYYTATSEADWSTTELKLLDTSTGDSLCSYLLPSQSYGDIIEAIPGKLVNNMKRWEDGQYISDLSVIDTEMCSLKHSESITSWDWESGFAVVENDDTSFHVISRNDSGYVFNTFGDGDLALEIKKQIPLTEASLSECYGDVVQIDSGYTFLFGDRLLSYNQTGEFVSDVALDNSTPSYGCYGKSLSYHFGNLFVTDGQGTLYAYTPQAITPEEDPADEPQDETQIPYIEAEGTMTWDRAVEFCENEGGYLPTRDQLKEADLNADSGISDVITQEGYYWSSTLSTQLERNRGVYRFRDGLESWASKYGYNHVICFFETEQPVEFFAESESKMNWFDATEYCADQGGQLPERDTLENAYADSGNALPEGTTQETSYWSSTESPDYDRNAGYFHFGTNFASWAGKYGFHQVVCVR